MRPFLRGWPSLEFLLVLERVEWFICTHVNMWTLNILRHVSLLFLKLSTFFVESMKIEHWLWLRNDIVGMAYASAKWNWEEKNSIKAVARPERKTFNTWIRFIRIVFSRNHWHMRRKLDFIWFKCPRPLKSTNTSRHTARCSRIRGIFRFPFHFHSCTFSSLVVHNIRLAAFSFAFFLHFLLCHRCTDSLVRCEKRK